MATVIDTLVTRFAFQSDRRGLQETERGIDRFKARTSRVLAGIGKGVRLTSAAVLAIGGASFFTGSPAEREFLKLQTQLGLTADEVAAIRPRLRELSAETARPLQEIAAGYFSLRSAGLDAAAAEETLRASTFAANAQLGSTRDIAHVAGGAINAYGADVISGSRVTDIMIATVKEGNLEAQNLTRGFGELLQVAPLLGVEMEQLGAIIAGGTRASIPANIVMTQLRQILFGLLRPTETAKKNLSSLGISVEGLQKRVREDGLIATLQWLREETGEDTEAFSRLFESQEAVGLIMDITGKNAAAYRSILSNLRNETGLTDKAQQDWAATGFSQQEIATNDAKLALDKLYNEALVPLLRLFGELPTAAQQVIIVFGALSGASLLLGFGGIAPLILGLLLLLGKLVLIGIVVGVAAAIIAGIIWLFQNWGTAVAWLREQWDRMSPALRLGAILLGLVLAPMLAIPLAIAAIVIGLVHLIRNWDAVTTWIKDRLNDLLHTPVLGDILRAFGATFSAIGQAIREAIGGAITFVTQRLGELRNAPLIGGVIQGIGAASSAVGSATSHVLGYQGGGVGEFFGFARGGIVPGPRGAPRAAIVHGGEGILPPALTRALLTVAEGPQLPDPGLGLGGGSSISLTISEGAIVVNAASGQNPSDVADETIRRLRDEIGGIVRAFDGSVQR